MEESTTMPRELHDAYLDSLLAVEAKPKRSKKVRVYLNRKDINRSCYTPRFCENLRPQQRYARQQARIAARKGGAQ